MNQNYLLPIKLLLVVPAIAAILYAPASIAEEGHCTYVLQYDKLDASFEACEMPADYAKCDNLKDTISRSAVTFGKGACPTTGAVGTCVIAKKKFVYYQGNASDHENGCGRLGGKWLKP